jgi:hypothetical protein
MTRQVHYSKLSEVINVRNKNMEATAFWVVKTCMDGRSVGNFCLHLQASD